MDEILEKYRKKKLKHWGAENLSKEKQNKILALDKKIQWETFCWNKSYEEIEIAEKHINKLIAEIENIKSK